MVRGGSWNNNPDNVRSSVRNNNHPDNRNNDIGFRVLCLSHIEICSIAGIASRLRLAGRGWRWMDGAGESCPHAVPSRHSYCYLPFSAGPRTCIGANMAMLEIQLVLVQVLQRFRVITLPEHPVEPVAEITFKPRHGLAVRVERR